MTYVKAHITFSGTDYGVAGVKAGAEHFVGLQAADDLTLIARARRVVERRARRHTMSMREQRRMP